MALRTYVVEDRKVVRQALIDMLLGFVDAQVVGWAETESDAIAGIVACDGQWDIVLTDLALAEGSGVGVLKFCGKRMPCQKVIVLTNYATAISRDACMEQGADRVFDKATEMGDKRPVMAASAQGAAQD